MREYRIGDLLMKGDAVDTVSRYELHFFNALYNLTPDKLNKFASPLPHETRDKTAGLYQKAYMAYTKHIRADSTKEYHDLHPTSTSVGIPSPSCGDRLRLQNRQIMKIHQAMIYGLVYDAIKVRQSLPCRRREACV